MPSSEVSCAGGGSNFAAYAEMLRSSIQPFTKNTRRPPTAIIFDSCPGEDGFSFFTRALLDPVKNRMLKFILIILIAPIYFTSVLLFTILIRQPGWVARIRQDLQRPDVLPWSTTATPRRYIYSAQDVMVSAHAVERHAAESRASGSTNVRLEKFEGSPHVAHFRTDPQRYWTIVQDTWQESVAVSRVRA